MATTYDAQDAPDRGIRQPALKPRAHVAASQTAYAKRHPGGPRGRDRAMTA